MAHNMTTVDRHMATCCTEYLYTVLKADSRRLAIETTARWRQLADHAASTGACLLSVCSNEFGRLARQFKSHAQTARTA